MFVPSEIEAANVDASEQCLVHSGKGHRLNNDGRWCKDTQEKKNYEQEHHCCLDDTYRPLEEIWSMKKNVVAAWNIQSRGVYVLLFICALYKVLRLRL